MFEILELEPYFEFHEGKTFENEVVNFMVFC